MPQVMQSRLLSVSRAYGEVAGIRAGSLDSRSAECSAGLIFFHCSKNGSSDTTRSLITGRFGSGATVTVSEFNRPTCVLQASRGTELMYMAQVPHIPTRQAHRNDSDSSCSH